MLITVDCGTTSVQVPLAQVSPAGGSAIYRNLQSSTSGSQINLCQTSILKKHNVGDICQVDVKFEGRTLFLLGAVYIHPKTSAEDVKLCLYQSLLPYSANVTKLLPNLQPDLETPIDLCGNFNNDPHYNSNLTDFMKTEFHLNYLDKQHQQDWVIPR